MNQDSTQCPLTVINNLTFTGNWQAKQDFFSSSQNLMKVLQLKRINRLLIEEYNWPLLKSLNI